MRDGIDPVIKEVSEQLGKLAGKGQMSQLWCGERREWGRLRQMSQGPPS